MSQARSWARWVLSTGGRSILDGTGRLYGPPHALRIACLSLVRSPGAGLGLGGGWMNGLTIHPITVWPWAQLLQGSWSQAL